MTLEIRDLDPGDVGRSFDIRTRAFGALPATRRPQWEADVAKAIGEGRMLAAYQDGLLVGRAMIRPFVQYWGGRTLPMAGVAGVVVSPEYRAQGVGTALMNGLARRGRALGFPVSALYPATVAVYRRTGWEVAGTQPRYSITTRLLRELRGNDVPVREIGPSEVGVLSTIQREQYAAGRVNGLRDYADDELAEELDDESVFAFAAEDGFVVYGWEGSELVVYQLVAGSAGTARALWAVVGSSSSVVDRVHAYLAPDDPIHRLLSELVVQEVKAIRWMLRLLDVRAAVSGRGFPAGVAVDVPLVIDDSAVPENAFVGRLVVSGGHGTLVDDDAVGGEGTVVRLGPNGLAALYAGTSTPSLVGSGLLSGGDAVTRSLLDTAFAGRPAHLLDYF